MDIVDLDADEMYSKAFTVLGGTAGATLLLKNIKIERSRYFKDQLGVIIKAASSYDSKTIADAVDYCIQRKLCSAGMFKNTLEHLNIKTSQIKYKKSSLLKTQIPSKCKGVKTEIRSISEYTAAFEGDKIIWKN